MRQHRAEDKRRGREWRGQLRLDEKAGGPIRGRRNLLPGNLEPGKKSIRGSRPPAAAGERRHLSRRRCGDARVHAVPLYGRRIEWPIVALLLREGHTVQGQQGSGGPSESIPRRARKGPPNLPGPSPAVRPGAWRPPEAPSRLPKAHRQWLRHRRGPIVHGEAKTHVEASQRQVDEDARSAVQDRRRAAVRRIPVPGFPPGRPAIRNDAGKAGRPGKVEGGKDGPRRRPRLLGVAPLLPPRPHSDGEGVRRGNGRRGPRSSARRLSSDGGELRVPGRRVAQGRGKAAHGGVGEV
mmetsp:Transcript_11007/g.23866  ORF Transcript_11007/g.23866 Transcript_11007/m.23866 type:complete len:294 (+) Transcript_11007:1137-2018(+)